MNVDEARGRVKIVAGGVQRSVVSAYPHGKKGCVYVSLNAFAKNFDDSILTIISKQKPVDTILLNQIDCAWHPCRSRIFVRYLRAAQKPVV